MGLRRLRARCADRWAMARLLRSASGLCGTSDLTAVAARATSGVVGSRRVLDVEYLIESHDFEHLADDRRSDDKRDPVRAANSFCRLGSS